MDQNRFKYIMVGLCGVKVGLTGVQKEQTGLKICLTRVKVSQSEYWVEVGLLGVKKSNWAQSMFR